MNPPLHAIWLAACDAPDQWFPFLTVARHWIGLFYGVAGGCIVVAYATGTPYAPTDTGGGTLIAPTAAIWLVACNAPAQCCAAWRWHSIELGCFTAQLKVASLLRIALAPPMHLPTRENNPNCTHRCHMACCVQCVVPVVALLGGGTALGWAVLRRCWGMYRCCVSHLHQPCTYLTRGKQP